MDFTTYQETRIRLYFRASVVVKGVISFAEIVAGILAFFVPLSVVSGLLLRVAQGELGAEPNDFLASHLVSLAQTLSYQSATFIALYLLSRGLIKFVLIIALLRDQLWAYPSSLAVLGLFVLYQLYQIATTLSGFIVLLTVFDLIVMWFIWREYQVMRSHIGARG